MLFLGAPPAEKYCVEGLASKAMSIVFSRVTATAANKLLRDLGINEVNGFEHTPLVVDEGTLFSSCLGLLYASVLHWLNINGYSATGLQDFDPFDYLQFPDEDTGTPAFLDYHTQQLRQCGVHIGLGGFKVHDLRTETLYHIEVDGKKYSGGVDGGLTPHSIMPSSAGSVLRIGFEHKQSTLDRDAFCARNDLTQVCDERKLKQGLNTVVQVASDWFCRIGQFLQKNIPLARARPRLFAVS